MLPGIDHSVHSSPVRTSSTVTGAPRSSMSLRVLGSMLRSTFYPRGLHGHPGCSPVRQPLCEPPRPVATRAQKRHRFVGEHAVGSAAVGDELLVFWNLLQVRLQPLQGHRACARYMSGLVLFLRAYV